MDLNKGDPSFKLRREGDRFLITFKDPEILRWFGFAVSVEGNGVTADIKAWQTWRSKVLRDQREREEREHVKGRHQEGAINRPITNVHGEGDTGRVTQDGIREPLFEPGGRYKGVR